MKKFLTKVLIFLLTFNLFGQGENIKYVEVSLTNSFYDYIGNNYIKDFIGTSDLINKNAYNLSISKNINDYFLIELEVTNSIKKYEYGYSKYGINLKYAISNYYIEYSNFKPYIQIGLGFVNIDKNELKYNKIGIGFNYWTTNYFGIKFQTSALITTDINSNHYVHNLGIIFRITNRKIYNWRK